MFNRKLKKYLKLAIKEAQKALNLGNFPYGAVLVNGKGNIIATGFNENFSKSDISAHAEIQCLRKIEIQKLLDKNESYHIFCSGEPCCGCGFFIARTNIKQICWALTDPQRTGSGDLKKDKKLDDFFGDIEMVEEPFADLKKESARLLKEYYRKIGKPEKMVLYD